MGRSGHLEKHKLIKTSTFAVFFMGTPHQGGEGLSILDAVTCVLSLVSYTNLALIEKIKPNSDWLLDLQERHSAISPDFRTICGYELRETYTPVRGRLLLVPKSSAILFAATDILDLAFDADHVTMVKFSGVDDPNFQKIIKRIELFSRLAVDDAASFGTVNAGDKSECHDKKGWDKSHTYNKDVGTPLEFSLGVTFKDRWNRHFTGRNSTLQLLKRMMAPSSTQDTFPLVVLYGPGGIGKTQLALQYTRRGQNHYSSIFWIDGTHPDTIETSVIACLERLKDHYVSHGLQNTSPIFKLINGSSTTETLGNSSSTTRSPIDRFLSWLSFKENTQWLPIIDNVDDLESVNLRDLLPTTRWGAVLVTSRRSDLAYGWDAIEVPRMDEDEAFALLQQTSKLVLTNGTEGMIRNRFCCAFA
ncbi:pfs domain-containing protein [Colletotrichum zoysiae]|uniref:Pfs domain-containing protein n=1 Tax=Colletotrichum zoysiae TaxID=1216348 RepID=A0AAD9LV15_9PEZI|nr:pfs domain-containing protein [Colletotrichum zoysiae]